MSDDILTQLLAIRADIAALREQQHEPLVYTRKEAASLLRVSLAQLYRLLAAGRLTALPSGIAREELERFVRTPQTKLRSNATRGKRVHRASEEAAKVRAWLKRERRPRGAI